VVLCLEGQRDKAYRITYRNMCGCHVLYTKEDFEGKGPTYVLSDAEV